MAESKLENKNFQNVKNVYFNLTLFILRMMTDEVRWDLMDLYTPNEISAVVCTHIHTYFYIVTINTWLRHKSTIT